jgi:hypothetical protein
MEEGDPVRDPLDALQAVRAAGVDAEQAIAASLVDEIAGWGAELLDSANVDQFPEREARLAAAIRRNTPDMLSTMPISRICCDRSYGIDELVDALDAGKLPCVEWIVCGALNGWDPVRCHWRGSSVSGAIVLAVVAPAALADVLGRVGKEVAASIQAIREGRSRELLHGVDISEEVAARLSELVHGGISCLGLLECIRRLNAGDVGGARLALMDLSHFARPGRPGSQTFSELLNDEVDDLRGKAPRLHEVIAAWKRLTAPRSG